MQAKGGGRGGDPFWWGSPIYDADHIPFVLNATDERRTNERREIYGSRKGHAGRMLEECSVYLQLWIGVELNPRGFAKCFFLKGSLAAVARAIQKSI